MVGLGIWEHVSKVAESDPASQGTSHENLSNVHKVLYHLGLQIQYYLFQEQAVIKMRRKKHQVFTR